MNADAKAAAMEPARAPEPTPRWLRRRPMELLACIVIAAGLLMMLQPFAMALYTASFVTTLSGTVLFMIVSRFPD